MKPIDYIYKNLDSFNISIFKQIVEDSGETPSEDIYDYLMETTWNTNPALLKQFGLDIERSGEDESEEEDSKHLYIAYFGDADGAILQGSDFETPAEVFSYCEAGNAEKLIMTMVSQQDDIQCGTQYFKNEEDTYIWQGMDVCSGAMIRITSSEIVIEWE